MYIEPQFIVATTGACLVMIGMGFMLGRWLGYRQATRHAAEEARREREWSELVRHVTGPPDFVPGPVIGAMEAARKIDSGLWSGLTIENTKIPRDHHSAGGGATVGTPVASYVAEHMPDAHPLDRGKPRDGSTEGGIQPADESLIDRRL